MAHAAAPTTHILDFSQLEADNEDECETGNVPPGKISEQGKIVETGKKARNRWRGRRRHVRHGAGGVVHDGEVKWYV